MLRIFFVKFNGQVLRSTFVTVAMNRRRFEINFPVSLSIEDKTKIIDQIRLTTSTDDNIQIEAFASTDSSQIPSRKIGLSISEKRIGTNYQMDIHKLIKRSLTSETLSDRDCVQNIVDDIHPVTINEIKQNNNPNIQDRSIMHSSRNITVKEILEDIKKYPNCAIPKRIHLNKSKWRLRNMYRLGIN